MPRRRRVDDDQVEAAVVVQLVQLLHRHVLLRARQRAGDVAVEAVLEDALGLLRRLAAYSATSSSKVDLVSSISAHSSPGQSPVDQASVSFVSDSRARARRPAAWPGSIVTTTARRPVAPPPARATAAVVVLPTPPVPQQTHDVAARRRAPLSGLTRTRPVPRPGARRVGERRRSRPSPRSAVNRNGSSELRQRQRSRQPLDLLELQRLAARAGSRRPLRATAASPSAQRRAGGLRRRDGVGVEPVEHGVDAVHDDRPEVHADAVLERERGLDHLVDRRLLGQRDEHDLAARRVGEQLEHVLGLRLDRARRARRRAGRGRTSGT